MLQYVHASGALNQLVFAPPPVPASHAHSPCDGQVRCTAAAQGSSRSPQKPSAISVLLSVGFGTAFLASTLSAPPAKEHTAWVLNTRL
ncbi:hypothetical protein SKAU_G00002750 [Synaphobranchus kaupii]|uniref:Uncharacterized protein n=1 Tax=Synaphobranchus kaupii TaxID=118154 RepID=A0A9Q1JCK8_SYNKA|nr:hypothetical protein SKAU_G00002750 [Synaphobranchus kaupii]